MITYEYPFNERVRTLLRLEDLFDKAGWFLQLDGAYEHHAALLAIFEILEVCARSDLKLDLIQELERQRQTLLAFRNNPDISEEALSGALYEIEQASAALLGLAGKVGQHLRDNDWLMNVKGRAAIPGGVCEFDVPSYHQWLHRGTGKRRIDIERWMKPMLPLRDALVIVLRLLRASGRAEAQTAVRGSYQKMLGGASASQMVRVELADDEPGVPEVSANKYALNVRFVCAGASTKPRQCEHDVAFRLTFCNL